MFSGREQHQTTRPPLVLIFRVIKQRTMEHPNSRDAILKHNNLC